VIAIFIVATLIAEVLFKQLLICTAVEMGLSKLATKHLGYFTFQTIIDICNWGCDTHCTTIQINNSLKSTFSIEVAAIKSQMMNCHLKHS